LFIEDEAARRAHFDNAEAASRIGRLQGMERQLHVARQFPVALEIIPTSALEIGDEHDLLLSGTNALQQFISLAQRIRDVRAAVAEGDGFRRGLERRNFSSKGAWTSAVLEKVISAPVSCPSVREVIAAVASFLSASASPGRLIEPETSTTTTRAVANSWRVSTAFEPKKDGQTRARQHGQGDPHQKQD